MIEAGAALANRTPAYRYHLLRVASERYRRDPANLDPDELAQAARQAEKSLAIEIRVLASSEAVGVVLLPGQLDAALATVAARYPDTIEMAEDLARNGLDEPALRAALHRELVFDAVMRRVGARHDAVTADDVERFYRSEPGRFAQPEQRTASHILITINEDFAENSREAAMARIEALAATLRTRPQTFEELARRHSECPSALQGGRLGTLARGQLYPQLDAVLFALEEGGISPPVESEVGLHLVCCERIRPARTLSLAEARERIHELLTERRRRASQQSWLATLQQDAN